MRKNALIVIAVLAVFGGIFYYFAQDHYLERAFEKSGEAVVGAKVEIDNLHFSFWNLEGSWDRIQIANPNDPWKNVIDAGKAGFSVETRPLYWGRFIIRELLLENVMSGTQRKTDGSLPKNDDAEAGGFIKDVTEAIEQQIRELPALDVQGLARELKIDSLIDVQQLFTVQGYQQLSSVVDSSRTFWQNAIEQQNYAQQLTTIEQNVRQLLATKVNNAASAAKTLKQADATRDKVQALKSDLEGKRTALRQNYADIDSQLTQLRGALQADIEKAKRVAKLKELDTRDIGLLLFGEPVVAQVDEMMHYIALARKYLPVAEASLASEDEVETPPRFEGVDISFPFKYRYPRFLIRSAKLTGATHASDSSKTYALSGEVIGLTNEPFIFGQPTRFEIDASHPSKTSYNLRGVFDHTEKPAKDTLRVAVQNFRPGKMKLGASDVLPSALLAERGDAALTGFFVGKDVDLKIDFAAREVSFDFTNQKSGIISKTVRRVLEGLKRIEVQALLGGRDAKYGLSIQSNIDNALAGQIKKLLGENLKKSRERVETFVKTEVGEYQSRTTAQVQQFRQGAVAKIDAYTAKIEEERAKLEQLRKDLEARVEAEKKKVAEVGKKKAKKRLGGLLGKKNKKAKEDTTKQKK